MNIKKGEISTTFIVQVIFLLIAFGILIWFFLNYFYGNTTVDKEVCHESVILRGTVPSITQSYVPLKCKTQKYCLTAGGGKCEADFGTAGGVGIVNVKSVEDIERFLAREIVDCWNTMGEGKITLFSQYFVQQTGFGEVYPTCVICSRVAYDKPSLIRAGIKMEQIDLHKYMLTHKVPGEEITYYAKIAAGEAKLSMDQLFPAMTMTELAEAEKFAKENKEKYDLEGMMIDDKAAVDNSQSYDESAILFMQISAPKHGEVLNNYLKAAGSIFGFKLGANSGGFFKNVGAGTANLVMGRKTYATAKTVTEVIDGAKVTTTISTGSKVLPSAVKFLKITPATKVLVAIGVAIGMAQQSSVAYNRAVVGGYCGDVAVGNSAREGCSVVRVTDYNGESLSQFCSVIESLG